MTQTNPELSNLIKSYNYYFRYRAYKKQIRKLPDKRYVKLKDQAKTCTPEMSLHIFKELDRIEPGQEVVLTEIFQGNIFFEVEINVTYQLIWVRYALLYVAIEAMQMAGLVYESLNILLNQKDEKNKSFKSNLKRFRNYIFHYQKGEDPFEESTKFLDFVFSEGASDWINRVDEELASFFAKKRHEIASSMKNEL